MPLIIEDRVLEQSTSVGTGALTLLGAVLGFRSFAAVCSVADTVWYYIEGIAVLTGLPSGEYEYGLGTYSSANVLTRTTVRGSSSSGALVNLTAGTKLVGIGVLAPRSAATIAEWLSALGVVAMLRGHLAGYTMSSGGGSIVMSITAGVAVDSTNTAFMSRAVITKTTAAYAFGDGVGGLDTGVIANSTWYHFYAIRRPDTGAVDVLFSTNATTPTLPANYTQYRRIGSGKTNGSAQWVAFFQDGDDFHWLTPVTDVSTGANPGAAAVTRTLASVPSGVNVMANLQIIVQNSGSGGTVYSYHSDLALTDMMPSTGLSDTPASAVGSSVVTVATALKLVRTNTSAQIRSRLSFSDANVAATINTLGWTDTRGRYA